MRLCNVPDRIQSVVRKSNGGSLNFAMNEPPDPARVVADADVLAADLFIDGASRDALDLLRSHSWLELVVTEALIEDTKVLISDLAESGLADDWERWVRTCGTVFEPSIGGHSALVAAHAGNAATVLSLDDRLLSAQAGVAIRPHVTTSIKSPTAFCKLVDPSSLYETLFADSYPGPDIAPECW